MGTVGEDRETRETVTHPEEVPETSQEDTEINIQEEGDHNNEKHKQAADTEMMEIDTDTQMQIEGKTKPRWGDEGWSDDDDVDRELQVLKEVLEASKAADRINDAREGSGDQEEGEGTGDQEHDRNVSEGGTTWNEQTQQWEQSGEVTITVDDENEDEYSKEGEEDTNMLIPQVTPNRDKRKQGEMKNGQKVSPASKSPRKVRTGDDREMEEDEEVEAQLATQDIVEESDEMNLDNDTPPKSNPVRNPYIRAEATSIEGPNYLQAVADGGRQTRIRTHAKTRERYETVFEVAFNVPRNFPQNPTERDEADIMTEKLDAIGRRAKIVDRRARINACMETTDAPTINKVFDIPVKHHELAKYLRHMYSDRRIRGGRNSGWKVRITTSIPSEEFLHYWEISKREHTSLEYVTLRKAPMQTATYHIAGYMLNSSDGQITDELERALKAELGCEIGIQHRPAPLDKRTSDDFWNQAKKEATDNYGNVDRRKLFQHAPFALGIYAETRQNALLVAEKMHNKYGKQTEDGQYPRLPDGTRMRFVPASIYLDMAGRSKAGELFKQQIFFQNNVTLAPIPIRDPNRRFEEHHNRTMQELILDLLCAEKSKEPFFRHLKPKYFRNFKTREYMVSIHNEMYHEAANVLRNLKQVLTDKYSAEVGDALMDRHENEPEMGSHQGATASFSGISLDVSDRYLNGQGNFVILGIEKIGTNLDQVRGHGEDARSLQLRSTASDMTGHTGNTIPEPPGEGDNITEASGRTTIPSLGPTSTITATSEFTSPEWQLKGDTMAEAKLRKRVMDAQVRQGAPHDAGESKATVATAISDGTNPETPTGSEESAFSI